MNYSQLQKEYKELCKQRHEIGMLRINLTTSPLINSEGKEKELRELNKKFAEINQRLKEILNLLNAPLSYTS